MPTELSSFKHMASPVPDFGGTWANREKIAERTGKLNFGCNFLKGQCVSQRRGMTDCRSGCCHSCASKHGYFQQSARHLERTDGALNPEAVGFLEANFDPQDGFWREGKGCCVPRKWRSLLCLTYRCFPAKSERRSPFPIWFQQLYKRVWRC